MTPQELKNSILQLAIQGKLVEQHSEEGTAEELYQQIQQEKQRLIKEGKIKKEKPLPEITEEEKPFDIPEGWIWVRLRNVVYNRGQLTPTEAFCYIDIGSIDNKRQRLNPDETIIQPDKAPSRARKEVEIGDIIYSTVRPYLHNMAIIDRSFSHKPIASTGFAAMVCHNGVYNKYLFNYLLAPAFDSYANATDNAKGVAYPAINDDRLYRAVIPLPPLAEQKRIVAKIEELLPLIDRYEKAWNQLEEFNKRFPDDMHKSILQMAIQGKLVEQRPEEGTGEELYRQIQVEKQKLIKEGKIKKEKPLPEITEEEKPFDIPESWKHIRLGDVITLLSGTDFPPERYNEKGIGTPYITGASSLCKNGVILNRWTETPTNIAEFGDVLLVCKGSGYGKTVICNIKEAHIARQIMAIKHSAHFDMNYLRYYLQANLAMIKANGQGVIPGIDRNSVLSMVFPLPPLAEQKRIVVKLEELLPLCCELL